MQDCQCSVKCRVLGTDFDLAVEKTWRSRFAFQTRLSQNERHQFRLIWPSSWCFWWSQQTRQRLMLTYPATSVRRSFEFTVSGPSCSWVARAKPANSSAMEAILIEDMHSIDCILYMHVICHDFMFWRAAASK